VRIYSPYKLTYRVIDSCVASDGQQMENFIVKITIMRVQQNIVGAFFSNEFANIYNSKT
jgi:hypothetical protein